MERSRILCESSTNHFINGLTRCSLDTQDNFGGGSIPTFRQHNPTAYNAIKKAYLTYIKVISSMENGTELVQKTTKFGIPDLTYTSNGLPRVPAAIRNIHGVETNLTQQQIIRSYMTKHYSM